MSSLNVSYAELRKWAWHGLWKECWFWKVLAVSVIFGLITQMAQAILKVVFIALGGVADFGDLEDLMNAAENGTAQPEITSAMVVQLVLAFAIAAFVTVIFAGIASYAVASASLSCARGRVDWFARSFDGFKRPFALAWLYFRLMLIYLVWLLPGMLMLLPLFVIPAITVPAAQASFLVGILFMACLVLIPFYRYRFAFLVIADNPGLSAEGALRRTRELMHGNMRKSFALDCSYWRYLLFMLICAIVMSLSIALLSFTDRSGGGVLMALLGRSGAAVLMMFLIFVSTLSLIVASWILVFYIKMGQTGLYLALAENWKREHADECA